MMRPLQIVIVGDGRMGQAVNDVAKAHGHYVVAMVGRDDRLAVAADAVDVAIEFTHADCAAQRIDELLTLGLPVVSGTTGCDDQMARASKRVRAEGGALLWSPNFSLGIKVMDSLVAMASAKLSAVSSFEPYLVEHHHRGKRDAPSGTAKRLAETAIDNDSSLRGWTIVTEQATQELDRDQLSVAAIRGGGVPGTHELGWHGPHESLRLIHEVRDRRVFAEGAVTAAAWLVGRRGAFTLDDLFDS